MKYLWGKSFTVPMGGTKAYRDGWDAIFGAKVPEDTPEESASKEADSNVDAALLDE